MSDGATGGPGQTGLVGPDFTELRGLCAESHRIRAEYQADALPANGSEAERAAHAARQGARATELVVLDYAIAEAARRAFPLP